MRSWAKEYCETLKPFNFQGKVFFSRRYKTTSGLVTTLVSYVDTSDFKSSKMTDAPSSYLILDNLQDIYISQ